MEKTDTTASVDPQLAQRALAFMLASTEGVVFYDQQQILDCNPAFEKLLGRSREILVGTSALYLFAAKDQEVASRHMFLGLSSSYLARLGRPDGTRVNVEIAGRQWLYQDRPCWVATVRDTSNMAAVTQSLVRSQTRYRSLVENADQVIMFVQDRKVAYANPSAAQFFKTDAALLRNTESLYLIHPDDRALALLRRKAMIAGDPDRSVMLRTISPPSKTLQNDSVVSWVRFYGSLVEWEERASTLIFMTDLTVQHETQERMRKALAQEKELGDLKTRFVSMASHEFRTPLSTIQTSSELLQHYNDRLSARERDEAVGDIQRSVQRMQAMMDNFLAFGRMSDSVMHCNPQPTELLALVNELVQETLAADGYQHMVHVHYAQPINEQTRLHLDAMLLRQMLGNLLGNACKYSQFGQTVDLHLSQQAAGENTPQKHLKMVVVDRGIGIPAYDLPLLFESFHRGSNAVNLPGTGLGLAIVDRAVRAHGGHVLVSSTEGQGSEFSLLLPWTA
jgi:PAS domain S-box-containing protein